MTIVVTGAGGFIGQNLLLHLAERGHSVVGIGSDAPETELVAALEEAELVFHLAGVNRPPSEAEFVSGNVDFTRTLCRALAAAGRATPVIFSSSIQAIQESAYGRSKRAAEDLLLGQAAAGSPVRIFRLANVFGKWARPNYNSAVATFSHNTARGLDITVNDPEAPLNLVYIDDVCAAFLALMEQPFSGGGFADVEPVYRTTVGAVADTIRGFPRGRETITIDRVGGV